MRCFLTNPGLCPALTLRAVSVALIDSEDGDGEHMVFLPPTSLSNLSLILCVQVITDVIVGCRKAWFGSASERLYCCVWNVRSGVVTSNFEEMT